MDALKPNLLAQSIDRNKILRGFVVFFLLATLLSACAVTRNSASPPQALPQTVVVQEDLAYTGEVTNNEYQPAPGPGIERMVIQYANLSLVVDDPEGAKAIIARLADEMGGYVVNARVYQDTAESGIAIVRAEILVRIPAEKLEQALAQMRELSAEPPLSESLDSQDATREYIDLQSRLRNEEAAEAQLTSIMEQATDTEDVLSVYEQLVQVRERIEVLKGQIQYYEQSAALSSVQVSLLPNEAMQPLTIGSWQPAGVAKSAVQALLNAARFIAYAVIWVAVFVLPILVFVSIVFVLPIWLIARAIVRRHQRRQSSRLPVSSEKPQGSTQG